MAISNDIEVVVARFDGKFSIQISQCFENMVTAISSGPPRPPYSGLVGR